MQNLHSLLSSQIDTLLPGLASNPEFAKFFEAVNTVYVESNTINGKAGIKIKQPVVLNSPADAEIAGEPEGLGTFEIDFSLFKSRFSENAASLIGLTQADTVFTEDLLLNLRKNVHADDLQKLDKAWILAMKSKKDLHTTFRIISKEGKTSFLDWDVKNLFGPDGKLIRISGTLTDVTLKIVNERNSAMARLIIENSPTILIRWKLAGGFPVEYISENIRQFGYTTEEFTEGNLRYDQIIFAEDLERIKTEVAAYREKGIKVYNQVYRIITKIGELRWVEDHTTAEEASADDSKFHHGLVTDITERVNDQEQLVEYSSTLEKINKELDQFAYIVSHDLKAPLRAISNLSVWIEEDLEGKLDNASLKNFELLRSRIKRMESLITGVLEYSRAGRIKSELQPVNMHTLVKEIIDNLAPPEGFKIEIAETLPVVQAEKLAIEQVFSNYISNTLKYNRHETPAVLISSVDRGNFYEFSVKDNGPGIDPQFHSKIFEIFQTLQARDQVESTGVGLAIVKKIVEEKGGKAWVESELGKGAEFFFTVPKMQ